MRSVTFYQIKASSVKQAGLKDMFKRPPRVSVCQPFCYLLTPLSPNSSNYFSYEHSRKQRRQPQRPWASRWKRYPNWI